MRNIIIGDIHGCSRALQDLLGQVKPDPVCDRLILLGDLFDRGPESWEVLQTVKKLEAAFGDRFVLLRGNHEDYLLQTKLPFMQRLVWERVGRSATVRSFRRHHEKMEDSAGWIREHAVLYWKSPGNADGTGLSGKAVLSEKAVFPDGAGIPEHTGLSAADAESGADRSSLSEADAGPGAGMICLEKAAAICAPPFQCVHAGILVDPIEANDSYTLIHDHAVVLRNRYAGPLTITGHIALEEPTWFPGRNNLSESPEIDLVEEKTAHAENARGKSRESGSAEEKTAHAENAGGKSLDGGSSEGVPENTGDSENAGTATDREHLRSPAVLPYGTRLSLPRQGVLCIDTGCGKGGKLTAMVIEGGFFSLYCAAQ